MVKVKVVPKQGVQVRQEDGTVIPAEGVNVFLTSYLRRRINDGDLVLTKAASKTAAKTGDK